MLMIIPWELNFCLKNVQTPVTYFFCVVKILAFCSQLGRIYKYQLLLLFGMEKLGLLEKYRRWLGAENAFSIWRSIKREKITLKRGQKNKKTASQVLRNMILR